MKKIKQFIVMLAVTMLTLGMMPATQTYASGTVTVSVSASTLNIGDTVTITAKAAGPGGEAAVATLGFNYDSSKLSFVSCSEAVYGGGAGGFVSVANESASITLKATAAGSASISVSGSDAVSLSDATVEYGELSAGGTSITINNAAATTGGTTTGGTTTGGETTASENLSGDNSLKTLSISPGTLSPSFKYSTTKYTASVGADVTSIAVSAEPSNAKATVESVTGNENLVEGQNTIKIVVKAENGVTATYTIVVTKGEGVVEEEEPEEEGESETDEPVVTSGIVINEVAYTISEEFSEEEIPEDFTETTVSYQGVDYQGISFDKGNLVMLYLVEEEGESEGSFFVYDQNRGTFYSYAKVVYGERYVIALLPPQDTTIPATYIETQLVIEGIGTISAYQQLAEDETTIPDFYLFYAINSDGTEGWYQYDSAEGTCQRLNGVLEEEVVETDTTDLEYLQNQYNDLSDRYAKDKDFTRKVIGVLIFLCAILLIVIINLLLRGRNNRGDGEDDDLEEIEEEELEELEEDALISIENGESVLDEEPEEAEVEDEFTEDDFMDESVYKERKRNRKQTKKEDKSDDEIEVLDLNDL